MNKFLIIIILIFLIFVLSKNFNCFNLSSCSLQIDHFEDKITEEKSILNQDKLIKRKSDLNNQKIKNKKEKAIKSKIQLEKKNKSNKDTIILDKPKVYQPECRNCKLDKVNKYNKNMNKIINPAVKNMEKHTVAKNLRNEFHQEPTHPDSMYNWGWSYMPPSSWSVPQKRPPPCIPQKECPVCPNIDDKYANSLDWDGVGSVMPDFIHNKIYNKDYYYPGWVSGTMKNVPEKDNLAKCEGDKCYNYWKCNNEGKCTKI